MSMENDLESIVFQGYVHEKFKKSEKWKEKVEKIFR